MKLSEVIKKEIEKTKNEISLHQKLINDYKQLVLDQEELKTQLINQLASMERVFSFALEEERTTVELRKQAKEGLDISFDSSKNVTEEFMTTKAQYPFGFVPDGEYSSQDVDSLFEMPTQWADIEVMTYQELEHIWFLKGLTVPEKVMNAISQRELDLLTFAKVETAKMLDFVFPKYLDSNGE